VDGDAISIRIQMPLGYFFDNHMHIMSGNCSPLPVIWYKNFAIDFTKPNRLDIDLLGAFVLGSGGRLQYKNTGSIAKRAVEELDTFFEKCQDEKFLYDYNDFLNGRGTPFTLQFVMSMDMDYTHIEGYYGQMLYHYDEKAMLYFYYLRDSGLSPEEKGQKTYLDPSEVVLYENYKKQLGYTTNACIENPFRLLPLYHYDPRRWNYLDKNDVIGALQSDNGKPYATDDLAKGTWDYPLTKIAGRKVSGKPGLFIGIKMYTPQGYRPFDDKCKYLENFYKQCEDEQIPIINHCSAGGNTIPETKFYMEHIKGSFGNAGSSDSDATSMHLVAKGDPVNYFIDNFVHPKAWRKVLEKHKNLKICLAHFGAAEWEKPHTESEWIQEMIALMEEFPNVYTDIACFDFKKNQNNFGFFLRCLGHRKVLNKILFGTDWYMSLLTAMEFNAHRIWDLPEIGLARGRTYETFIKQWKCFFDSINPALWTRFSIINTYNFYDLGNKVLLDNLEKGFCDGVEKQRLDCSQFKLKTQFVTDRRIQLDALPQKIIDLKKFYGIKDE
jgi:hypothetical protein